MDEDIKKTEETTEEFVDEYSEALDAVPEEVRTFLWSDAFTLILKAIGDTYALTEPQREVVRQITMETVAGTITPVARQIRLSDAGITGDLQDTILSAVNDEIISRVMAQLEFQRNIDEETPDSIQQTQASGITPVAASTAPSPTEALAMIKERLTNKSAIATTKRDYSAEPTEKVTAPTPQGIKSIDPYRELPEK